MNATAAGKGMVDHRPDDGRLGGVSMGHLLPEQWA